MNKSGQYGEDLAVEYLKRKGYEIIARNWRGEKKLRAPEIDIIARRSDILIFIEVKTSSTGKFGRPEYWIDRKKRDRIAKGAEAFLSIYETYFESSRFDAITVDRECDPPRINHIKNAFLVSDL